MLRMSKITDYGIVLLVQLANEPENTTQNARELAATAHLPLPIVSKTLKALTRRGLLVSHRGVKGGFELARRADQISVADVIDALEGPIGITECAVGAGQCDRELHCNVREPWQQINQVLTSTLRSIRISDLCAGAQTSGDMLVNSRGELDRSLAEKTH